MNGQRQPHVELGAGHGYAEKVAGRRGGGIAGVGDGVPVVGLHGRAPVRAIGNSAHPVGFGEAVEKIAAAHLHLREQGGAGRAGILIRPEIRKDLNIPDARLVRIRIQGGTTAGRVAKPHLLPA